MPARAERNGVRGGRRQFTIGVLATQTRVSPHTILYYERRGLLPSIRRSGNGYRLFSGESVRRIRFIKQAQRLGFSLREIQEILALGNDPKTTCADVGKRIAAKVAHIEATLRSLRATRKTLVNLAADCHGRRPFSECPILRRLEQETVTLAEGRAGR